VVENREAAVVWVAVIAGVEEGNRLNGFFSGTESVASGRVCDLFSGVPVVKRLGVVPAAVLLPNRDMML
jgi:hypothetical protein